jgi:hypothetical protein
VTKSTRMPAQQSKTTPAPWQGPWDEVAKFLIVRLGVAVPSVVLVWLVVACH